MIFIFSSRCVHCFLPLFDYHTNLSNLIAFWDKRTSGKKIRRSSEFSLSPGLVAKALRLPDSAWNKRVASSFRLAFLRRETRWEPEKRRIENYTATCRVGSVCAREDTKNSPRKRNSTSRVPRRRNLAKRIRERWRKTSTNSPWIAAKHCEGPQSIMRQPLSKKMTSLTQKGKYYLFVAEDTRFAKRWKGTFWTTLALVYGDIVNCS